MPSAHVILLHLEELYGERRSIRFEISRELFCCSITKGSDFDKHVVKMIGLIEHLESLSFDLSLPGSFSQFIMNYHLTKQEHTLAELLKIVTLTKKEMRVKGKETTLIASTSKAKKFKPKKSNSKKRKAHATKPSRSDSKKDKKNKEVAVEKGKCFHYNMEGH
ncbi:hypothetical protein ACH5RR_037088 [Cinchona calisaya]|uniref:Uncharacterized protein n=1 Tax=Cinchona calisaya TaxID=153742 RepID=A0ABD2Y9I7_9GENT